MVCALIRSNKYYLLLVDSDISLVGIVVCTLCISSEPRYDDTACRTCRNSGADPGDLCNASLRASGCSAPRAPHIRLQYRRLRSGFWQAAIARHTQLCDTVGDRFTAAQLLFAPGHASYASPSKPYCSHLPIKHHASAAARTHMTIRHVYHRPRPPKDSDGVTPLAAAA